MIFTGQLTQHVILTTSTFLFGPEVMHTCCFIHYQGNIQLHEITAHSKEKQPTVIKKHEGVYGDKQTDKTVVIIIHLSAR